MSVFDVPIACTMNMLECLNQNYWTTPPYGPVPDATSKLRLAVMGMLDALQIAKKAESEGTPMPGLPVQAEGVEVLETSGHGLHVRQVKEQAEAREKAEALEKAALEKAEPKDIPGPPPEPTHRAPEHGAREAPEPRRPRNTIL